MCITCDAWTGKGLNQKINELKPQYAQTGPSHLIKATQPFVMHKRFGRHACASHVMHGQGKGYPAGNGQVERLNNTLWKTIMLILRSRKLPITYWQLVLDDALHSIRSLLCTANNCTPHERLFNYQRRSTNGTAVPTWLLAPGPVLLKRRNRSNKYDALVQEVELIEVNPQYAHIRYRNGREDTVATKYLAPAGERLPYKSLGQQLTDADNMDDVKTTQDNEEEHAPTPNIRDDKVTSPGDANNDIPLTDSPERENVQCSPMNECDLEVSPDFSQSRPRRSQRARKAPDRLMYY